MMVLNQECYLTAGEVAKMTKIKVQTLANWRHMGKGIPYYKIGHLVRYRLPDVLAHMERHRIEPDSGDTNK